MPQFPAQYVVYTYMYLGIGLLFFNLFYMNGMPFKERLHQYRIQKWISCLRSMIGQSGAAVNHKTLSRKLGRVRQLRAFSDALETLREECPDQINVWLRENDQVFRDMALYYSKRDSMERAYCAWFLAHFSLIGAQDQVLLKAMIGYLDNSTIFCRENVLKAIYRSGSVKAVIEAFRDFNDREYYHNRKLLSDGLATFSGDQEALGWALWEQRKEWNYELIAATVQFITRMGPRGASFCGSFLDALMDSTIHPELTLSLIRYFARFRYEPARKLLQDLAEEKDQTLFAIVAVTALANYPGDDSIASLRHAVCSRNWYVRTNAAVSLIALTRNHPNREQLLNCPDPYGRDSIAYCLDNEKARANA